MLKDLQAEGGSEGGVADLVSGGGLRCGVSADNGGNQRRAVRRGGDVAIRSGDDLAGDGARKLASHSDDSVGALREQQRGGREERW